MSQCLWAVFWDFSVCMLLCFIKPMSGSRYSTWVSSGVSQSQCTVRAGLLQSHCTRGLQYPKQSDRRLTWSRLLQGFYTEHLTPLISQVSCVQRVLFYFFLSFFLSFFLHECTCSAHSHLFLSPRVLTTCKTFP